MSRDPFIDLDTLPPEIVEPILRWVEKRRNTPRFEQHIRLGFINLAIRLPPAGSEIRESKLHAVFHQYQRAAAASESVLRRQTVELQAQEERTLAQSRAEYLASLSPEDRGLLAARLAATAEADARAARGYDALLAEKAALAARVEELKGRNATYQALVDTLKKSNAQFGANWAAERRGFVSKIAALAAENTALTREITALRTETERHRKTVEQGNHEAKWAQAKNALTRHIDELVAERMRLLGELGQLRVRSREDRQRAQESIAAAEALIADRELSFAKQLAALSTERDALKRERALLATTVHNLMAENRRFEDWLYDARAQARGEARAGSNARRERDALRAEVAVLESAKTELEQINDWLQQKLRFRGQSAHAA